MSGLWIGSPVSTTTGPRHPDASSVTKPSSARSILLADSPRRAGGGASPTGGRATITRPRAEAVVGRLALSSSSTASVIEANGRASSTTSFYWPMPANREDQSFELVRPAGDVAEDGHATLVRRAHPGLQVAGPATPDPGRLVARVEPLAVDILGVEFGQVLDWCTRLAGLVEVLNIRQAGPEPP
jgi:hypothetical protein